MKWKAALDVLRRYVKDVGHGVDPVEALHAHVCGPQCWHWQCIRCCGVHDPLVKCFAPGGEPS